MAYVLDSDAKPLYQRVGTEPLEDAELELAIAAWQADHPQAGKLDVGAVTARLRRLNDEARERADAAAAGVTLQALRQARDERRRGEAEHRAAQDIAKARQLVAGEGMPGAPLATEGGYPSLEQIEVERRKLAAAGKPHGFDALGAKGPGHPFPGQRSTIRRRYKGLAPPGTPVAGICEHAPDHQHPRN